MITSSLLGIFVNYFNPDGIPLIREKLELSWASDSLFQEIIQDSASTIIDTTNLILENPSDNNNIRSSNKETEKNPDDQIVQPIDPVTDKLKETEVVSFEEPKALTLEQAYKLFNNGVKFVDARDEADYLAGHIYSAVNIPFDDFDNHKQKLEKLSKEKPIVIYCAGTDCDLSILLGNLLFEQGYKQVYVFFGGWLEWLNSNYPTENQSE
ncbi:MAG: rhodanese-like domain-containing protein [Ignavibacteriaceae bacterium]|nr:rhodanese-like domain-containing protein [Ignavibacteriaceae bacterium]